MTRLRPTVSVVLVSAIFFLFGAARTVAFAHDPAPVLVAGKGQTDPQKIGWLTDQGRKALTAAIDNYKKGATLGFVFAAGPGGEYWANREAAKSVGFVSIDELARVALQTCEYFRHAACFIVSVDGLDQSGSFGTLVVQPRLLSLRRGRFDPARIPFITSSDQVLAAGYATASGPRAFVVTPNGLWLWRNGKTVFDAIAAGDADCKKQFAGQVCVLYAVDSQVVFTPTDQ
jgi:hypothetical protein